MLITTDSVFSDIAIVTCVAALFAVAARILRLPLLIGYLVAGIGLAPIVSAFVPNHALMDGFQSIGLALLLFLVGMELDWTKTRQQVRSTLLLSVVQVAGSLFVGAAITRVTHFSLLTGLYIGLALSFSSTVVVIKLLSESGDLKSLHGRLAISTLLLQDLLSIAALFFLGELSTSSTWSWEFRAGLLIMKLAAVTGVTITCARFFLPLTFRHIAKSPELLFLTSLAWCFAFALAMEALGFPIEIGAFLAGISLGTLPYSPEILSRIRSLRDFFVILLFVSLGSTLTPLSSSYLALTAFLLAITVIARPLLSFITLALHGYRARTAFLTAITQAQLSEFSLVIIAVGIKSGRMDPQLASSISAAVVFSIIIATLLFTYRNALYRIGHPLLHLFERGHHRHFGLVQGNEQEIASLSGHIVIFGYHRMGFHIVRKALAAHQAVVVVDFDPEVIDHLRREGLPAIYGDAEDDHVLELAGVQKASLVISTIPHPEESLYLIHRIRKVGKAAKIIVTAHTVGQALHYYKEGADYVLLPYMLGGEHVGELIERHHNHSLDSFLKHRAEELKLLRAQRNALYYETE